MRGLRLARQDALEKIFERYAAHAAWMREIGIYQWNDTDYLGCIRRTTMRIYSGAGFFCARWRKWCALGRSGAFAGGRALERAAFEAGVVRPQSRDGDWRFRRGKSDFARGAEACKLAQHGAHAA